MRRYFMVVASILPSTLAVLPANAQSASFYNCQDKPVRISIGTMPLEKALAQFTSVTRCPVSIDADGVNDGTSDEISTTVTKGRYTPARALELMLRNTLLQSEPIKGGFSVTYGPNAR